MNLAHFQASNPLWLQVELIKSILYLKTKRNDLSQTNLNFGLLMDENALESKIDK